MSIRTKRSVGVQWGEHVALPLNPVDGMWAFVPGQEVPVGGSPDMLNCVVRGNILMKRPGYALFPSGMSTLGNPIMGLFSAQDADNLTYLFAATNTTLYQMAPGSGTWALIAGPALTGGTSRLFSWELSQNSVIFSQGIDQVMRAPFSGAYAILNANCPAAKYLTRYADRVFLAFTLESSVSKPYRVRRCVASDHTDWTGVGSGFHDLTESPYHIRGLRKLGSQLAVYTERSIAIGTRTETPDAPVRYDQAVSDIGLYGAATLQGRNEFHFFLGNDDFYMFDGRQVESIGWQIRDIVYPVLNIDRLHMMFSAITYDTQEYLAFLCTGSTSNPDTVWCYNWARKIWCPWSISGPSIATIHRIDDALTIDGVTSQIDLNTYEIDAQPNQAGYPSLLTGNTDGKVYKWSKAYLSDAGVSIPCRWSSKDFTPKDIGGRQDQKIILREIHVRYRGTGAAAQLQVQSSTNGGVTWTDYGTLSFAATSSAYNVDSVHKQVTGDQIRFRLLNNTTDQDFNILEIIPVFEKPLSKVGE
jgi:hypothetical protein